MATDTILLNSRVDLITAAKLLKWLEFTTRTRVSRSRLVSRCMDLFCRLLEERGELQKIQVPDNAAAARILKKAFTRFQPKEDWTMLKKRLHLSAENEAFEDFLTPESPDNEPVAVADAKYAAMTPEEQESEIQKMLKEHCDANQANS